MPPAYERPLIIAPHPDDETIASGGLLQRAIALGGAVRIVFVTDGDNNPWPVRFLKKKLHITDADRAEWGALRREESRRALTVLGASTESATFLGYPDRVLTPMARAGNMDARDALAALVNELAPSLLVVPSSFDLHADHRLIAWFAHSIRPRPNIVTYVVHGHPPQGRVALRLDLTPEEVARKRAAIECHQSQLVLSRKRLLSYARPIEEFFQAEHDVARLDSRLRGWSCGLRHAARIVTGRTG
jgi:Uncharacterized proteins, LmbE homologs